MTKKDIMLLIGATANSFVKDYAAHYNMPELVAKDLANWSTNKQGQSVLNAIVQPTGQMAALVAYLEVDITMAPNENGILYAYVRMSYRHHSGGSNGHVETFRIVSRKQLSKDVYDYVGFIPHYLEYAHMIENDEARKRVEKEEKEKQS